MNELLQYLDVPLYALCVGAAFSLLQLLVIAKNRRQFSALLSFDKSGAIVNTPLVSVLIPARNEERTIERAVRSALHQNYPHVEVCVLNDGSTDQTGAILAELQHEFPERLRIIDGSEKPADWLGKNFACWQLSQVAKGELLLFIDADVWLKPEMINALVSAFQQTKVDMITVWPQQHLPEVWEQRVIPLVYQALLGLLPAIYAYRKPRWMPAFIYKRTRHWFAAACGQCIAFTRTAYTSIGGHREVRDKVVEDVELAKRILRSHHTMLMLHGLHSVYCRMYTQQDDMLQGFRKNFLAGFGFNIPLFLTMGIIQFLAYIFPWLLLIAGLYAQNYIWAGAALVALGITYVHRSMLYSWFEWKGALLLNQALGVLWFQRLSITVLTDYFRKRQVQWKNRAV